MSPATARRVGAAARRAAEAAKRIEAIDLARGVAIALMILSHGVKGLLSFEQIPQWGLVPIHLMTKFSSSLFILVFGISLAVVHLPAAGTADWPSRRTRLIKRGLVVFFWYKALTILEMTLTMEGSTHLYTREDILDALFYRAFPVYVEILGFYALALLWTPLLLPLWKKAPLALRAAGIACVAVAAMLLQRHSGFWGIDPLKAILVEHESYYTWGQLSRAPLVLAGLLIGEWIALAHTRRDGRGHRAVALALAGAGGVMLALFAARAAPALQEALRSVALNEGKHPPGAQFTLFSVGGALLILSLALFGGQRLASVFRPITLIGTNALQAFVFHIAVLFVFFRYLLEYWHGVSYLHALFLSGLLLLLTALWVKSLGWLREKP